MRTAPGQVVAGRYRVTDRSEGEVGVPAVEVHDGARVRLFGLELPELLVPGHPPGAPTPSYGPRLTSRVAQVAAAAPKHPRLLRGLAAGPDGDVLWVAEEAVPGVPLEQLAGNGPVSPYRVAEIGADLAGALRVLHEAGLTHGNLTVRTVLVCEDGAAMLGGLLLGAAEEELCAALGGEVPRRVYETRALMLGPLAERWAIDPGAPADTWALGVLLYRLLTGHGPYPENDLPTLLAAVRDGRHHPAEGCGPLRSLVERLLRPDAAHRPTAVEVQKELRELLVFAPEPYPDGPPDPLLPVLRPAAGPLVPRPRGGRRREERSTDRQGPARPPRIAPRLLGPLVVAGVLVLLVAALAGIVLVAG
ncbi:protein kinase domain-containing protein [Streptomyces sp. TLI_171]|uniref:protein kinase domain-containing protein n=1 Tax=Streptomyces sp. TLI_171 TaxID=1938859 RepID=UPI000C18F05B|nr:protein kinase [Streptomyces sp. TLI_171]RKE19502.1 serine/threonine protein kinase [Streptomyces sp. TLI_171]